MTDIGLISVVTPVRNAERFVGRSIESVARQSYVNWQLILVDDGSTDRSVEICAERAAKDPRVRLIRLPDNRGPAAARNRALEEAEGDFLCFLDADDALEPDALGRFAEEQARVQADLVIGGFRAVDESGAPRKVEAYLEQSSVMGHREILGYLERYVAKPNRNPMFSYVWGKLYRASIVRDRELRFNEQLRVFEDTDFNFRLLRHVQRCSYVHEQPYIYTSEYHSPTTTSIEFRHKMFDPMVALSSLGQLFLDEHPEKTVAEAVGHACVSLCIIQSVRLCGAMTASTRREAREVLEAMVADPLVRQCLPHYRPTAGDSHIVPLLIKLKLVSAMMLVCRRKAIKRYGKLWKT
ncbi:MAG TPA: glycosyltransferase family 2 protein [Myxococcales bacterium]|jgi:GT2 family glycosyltransferase